MRQEIYSPTKHTFVWTEDWYTWDHVQAHRLALKQRNARAKVLRANGYRVKCFSLPGQMITKGGIGSGRPEISLVATVYGINFSKEEK
jgi:hypothetical protein